MTDILMPKATAVWLVDNTGLSFEQIAEFCRLHPLEVKGIADGDVAAGVRGADPIANGQLTREEIEKAEKDKTYKMVLRQPKHAEMMDKKTKGPRYTPLSRRQERPNAIAWMVKNHPEVSDAQMAKLIGTTKTTINAVRDRTHWNAQNIKPEDPVALGLCSQVDLDAVVQKAAKKRAKMEAEAAKSADPGLAPIAPELTTPAAPEAAEPEAASEPAPAPQPEPAPEPEDKPDAAVDADSVFASLGGLTFSKDEDEDEK
ncbi:MAG: DUF1013 domain-containing protein [Maricaulaceae bacterium]|jgi:hypothetical protein